MCSSFVAPFYISISVSTSYFLLSFLTPFCVSHFFCLAISVLSDETNWFPFCSSFPFLPKLLTYLTPIVHNIYLRFLYLHILFTEYCFASFFFFKQNQRSFKKNNCIELSLCLYWKCVFFVCRFHNPRWKKIPYSHKWLQKFTCFSLSVHFTVSRNIEGKYMLKGILCFTTFR